MTKASIVYDVISQKTGVRVSNENGNPLVRFFFDDTGTPNNNWQVIPEGEFKVVGSIETTDPFVQKALQEAVNRGYTKDELIALPTPTPPQS